jgi:hypothetical protein
VTCSAGCKSIERIPWVMGNGEHNVDQLRGKSGERSKEAGCNIDVYSLGLCASSLWRS